MPSMMMLSDTMFPRFTDETTDSERITVIQDYLYQLLEQLRYTLGNLEESNFNSSALDKIGSDITAELDEEVKVIRRALVGVNGNLDAAITGDSIVARLESNEGRVSQLTVTAAELTAAMSDGNGNLMNLSTTASALRTEFQGQVDGYATQVSSFEQTVSGFRTTVSNYEDAVDGYATQVSSFRQTAGKIDWLIASGTSASNFTMTQQAITLISQNINLTGYVTVDSLSTAGETEIDGGNITTGSINFAYSATEANGITFRYAGMLECGYIKLTNDNTNSAPSLCIHTNNEGVGIDMYSLGGIRAHSRTGISLLAYNYEQGAEKMSYISIGLQEIRLWSTGGKIAFIADSVDFSNVREVTGL